MDATPITVEDPENMTDSKKLLILSMAVNQVQTTTARHHELLVTGNGDLPLPERVRNLERYIENLKFWSRFVGTAIVLQTIAFGTAAIWYAVKLLPVLDRLSKLP